MTPKEKYKKAEYFRKAVQDKLKDLAKNNDTDIQRLYKQVAFGQFLARLFKHDDIEWALKGGHALELRLQKSRATKDIDLALKDNKIFKKDAESQNQELRNLLIEKSEIDLDDFFSFRISEPVMDLKGTPYGGARFHIEALLDQKTFSKFLLDIGIGDVWLEPQDEMVVYNHLENLGVTPQKVKVISIEQHISEKIHALTAPRGERPNSRVKDLIDLYLIFSEEHINFDLCKTSITKTFERRATHEIPKTLPEIPEHWPVKYQHLADTIDLKTPAIEAFTFVNTYYKKNLI